MTEIETSGAAATNSTATAEVDDAAPAGDKVEVTVAPAVAARSSVPMAPVKRKPSEASRARAADLKARKLDAIATRRATAQKMGKAEFIAEIVKGRFKPITAEEIAAEPTPAPATPPAV